LDEKKQKAPADVPTNKKSPLRKIASPESRPQGPASISGQPKSPDQSKLKQVGSPRIKVTQPV
jgi:hypothetical protein